MQKQIYFTKNVSKISTDDEQTYTCMLNIERDTNFHVSDAFLSFTKKTCKFKSMEFLYIHMHDCIDEYSGYFYYVLNLI